MNEFFGKALETIEIVEKEFGAGNGATKKEKAVNILNNLVDIPVIPEFMEKKVFGIVIDLVVFIFNKYDLFNKEQA